MISPDDLLEVARQLARGSTEASMRRSVSTAYYALFHLLVEAAVERMFPGADREPVRDWLGRAFAHGNMNEVARQLQKASVESISHRFRPAVAGPAIAPELKRVAAAFSDLQFLRHEADYNRSPGFGRDDARQAIRDAEKAFADWRAVEGTVQADAFLAGLLALGNIRMSGPA